MPLLARVGHSRARLRRSARAWGCPELGSVGLGLGLGERLAAPWLVANGFGYVERCPCALRTAGAVGLERALGSLGRALGSSASRRLDAARSVGLGRIRTGCCPVRETRTLGQSGLSLTLAPKRRRTPSSLETCVSCMR